MQVRIARMKTTSRPFFLGFCVVFAAASAVLLVSALRAATAYSSTGSAINHPISAADTTKQQEVLAPINQMFDGMTKRDAAIIKAPVLPGGVMVLMRDGKPTRMTFEEFAERVGKPGKTKIEERIHDPLIRVDNDLAVIWAPFEFLSDGKVEHCGAVRFILVPPDGKWIIASVADMGRNDCAHK